MDKMTHIGYVLGCDNRIPSGYKRKELLRETKLFWITAGGTKYKKLSGRLVGSGKWSVYYLDVKSINAVD